MHTLILRLPPFLPAGFLYSKAEVERLLPSFLSCAFSSCSIDLEKERDPLRITANPRSSVHSKKSPKALQMQKQLSARALTEPSFHIALSILVFLILRGFEENSRAAFT